jgi:hypothetical protein
MLIDSNEDARYGYYMQDMPGMSPEGGVDTFGTNIPMEGGWRAYAVL